MFGDLAGFDLFRSHCVNVVHESIELKFQIFGIGIKSVVFSYELDKE